ncbi:hypothetical protein [Pseudoduganella namucuonensis]|uniref:Uncharacterized protein n=1 Tax=Pseudoduganella namucuonensis TaxID=1035707 RepID=A0A1I7M0Z9_9BURK|nr:hypothetical protein [Pseudoduganella namucuonensis]SFV15507.1 hypothetical protein SAMN05216552_104633 [Pseudoduganella namucuonensis]
MTTQPMFTPNGDGYDIAPAGVLLLAADTAYGPPHETTPQGMRNARTLMDGILDAARAGGYTQGDILRTLLARNQPTRRVQEMAQAACDTAGAAALTSVFERARLA